MIVSNRRQCLRGMFAAPAIVAFDSLMPIKVILPAKDRMQVYVSDYIYDKINGKLFPLGYDTKAEIIKFVEREYKMRTDTEVFHFISQDKSFKDYSTVDFYLTRNITDLQQRIVIPKVYPDRSNITDRWIAKILES